MPGVRRVFGNVLKLDQACCNSDKRMRKGGGRESFANYALINSLQWWSVREVFKKIWKFLMAFAIKGEGRGSPQSDVWFLNYYKFYCPF